MQFLFSEQDMKAEEIRAQTLTLPKFNFFRVHKSYYTSGCLAQILIFPLYIGFSLVRSMESHFLAPIYFIISEARSSQFC